MGYREFFRPGTDVGDMSIIDFKPFRDIFRWLKVAGTNFVTLAFGESH
jgi:hypothetical protein